MSPSIFIVFFMDPIQSVPRDGDWTFVSCCRCCRSTSSTKADREILARTANRSISRRTLEDKVSDILTLVEVLIS